MTEAEWLGSADAWAMLQHLEVGGSDRKLRLFAVGCCRQVWDSIETIRCRRAVETAERFADGLATAAELRAVELPALNSIRNSAKVGKKTPWLGDRWSSREPDYDALIPLKLAAGAARLDPAELIEGLARLRLHAGLARQAPGLLRCIFGPRPVLAAPFDLGSQTPTVTNLARSIYEEHAFDLLPILGDALEESGCVDELILRHCRGRGPHARGCWVVDLILGKL